MNSIPFDCFKNGRINDPLTACMNLETPLQYRYCLDDRPVAT